MNFKEIYFSDRGFCRLLFPNVVNFCFKWLWIKPCDIALFEQTFNAEFMWLLPKFVLYNNGFDIFL